MDPHEHGPSRRDVFEQVGQAGRAQPGDEPPPLGPVGEFDENGPLAAGQQAQAHGRYAAGAAMRTPAAVSPARTAVARATAPGVSP